MIGYEFLLLQIPLRMLSTCKPAQVRSVTRVEELGEVLAVPRHVAPAAGASILDHALFALKHETLQPAILQEAMRLLAARATLFNASDIANACCGAEDVITKKGSRPPRRTWPDMRHRVRRHGADGLSV
jgi:hypothetical protein